MLVLVSMLVPMLASMVLSMVLSTVLSVLVSVLDDDADMGNEGLCMSLVGETGASSVGLMTVVCSVLFEAKSVSLLWTSLLVVILD